MKFDRGIIKWQPFDSVISGKNVIKSIMQEKEKIKKPILSEEETNQIEDMIIEAFYEESEVILEYYKNGFIKTIKGKIKKIDHITKMIYLNNTSLLFNQILSIHL